MRPLFAPDHALAFVKLVHAVAAGLVLLLLIILVASGGEDEEADAVADDSSGGAESKSDGKAKDDSKAPEETAKAKAGKKEEAVKPAATAKGPDLPDPSGSCKAFTEYPKFPWSIHISSLIDVGAKESICQLFGMPSDKVKSALKELPHFGPTGYDLLPGGELFEIFPLGKAERRVPTMEFVFVSGKLAEIRLDYGSGFADKFSKDLFEEALGKPADKSKDRQGRSVQHFVDGDLIVEQYERKDRYRRVFREIVFASGLVRDALKTEIDLREKAEAAFVSGMDAFNQRKADKAVDRFAGARNHVSSFGAAYVLEGITLIRQEKFTEASALGDRAIEVSRDKRALAEANGIKAVAALYGGKKDEAIKLFSRARDLDPLNGEFGNAVTELESDTYRPERVAKTAARMSCREKSKGRRGRRTGAKWTTEGLLARGNFPDTDTYFKALKEAKKDSGFEKEYKKWVGWECR